MFAFETFPLFSKSFSDDSVNEVLFYGLFFSFSSLTLDNMVVGDFTSASTGIVGAKA